MAAESQPIAAVMVHVADWRAGLEWYAKAFPTARVGMTDGATWGSIVVDGIQIELVPADEKVATGAAGTVVYWIADDFDDPLPPEIQKYFDDPQIFPPDVSDEDQP